MNSVYHIDKIVDVRSDAWYTKPYFRRDFSPIEERRNTHDNNPLTQMPERWDRPSEKRFGIGPRSRLVAGSFVVWEVVAVRSPRRPSAISLRLFDRPCAPARG